MSEETALSILEDGMKIYEMIVDSTGGDDVTMGDLVIKLCYADPTGQFLCSTARYLAAIDRDRYSRWINTLVERAINKDRDRKYIGSLLEALWGSDYAEHVEEYSAADDNFRRIYKRIYEGEKM